MRYALERLLYRLSKSAHRQRFVLKGAMLFATWVAAPFRPTRDLDRWDTERTVLRPSVKRSARFAGRRSPMMV